MYNCPHCSTVCYSPWKRLLGFSPKFVVCPNCGRKAQWSARAFLLQSIVAPIAAAAVLGLLAPSMPFPLMVVLAVATLIAVRFLIDVVFPLVPEESPQGRTAFGDRSMRILLPLMIVLALLAVASKIYK